MFFWNYFNLNLLEVTGTLPKIASSQAFLNSFLSYLDTKWPISAIFEKSADVSKIITSIWKIYISWKEQMKGRLPSKFQISSSFGSILTLTDCGCVCVCVCVCMCMYFTTVGFCFGPPCKNWDNFCCPRWFLVPFSWL